MQEQELRADPRPMQVYLGLQLVMSASWAPHTPSSQSIQSRPIGLISRDTLIPKNQGMTPKEEAD